MATGHTKLRRLVGKVGRGTHSEAARKLGVTYSILRTILAGKTPDVKFAFSARSAYGIRLEEWLDDDVDAEWPLAGPPDPT